MKVFLDKRYVKIELYEAFMLEYKNHEFIFDVEKSYDCHIIITVPSYVTIDVLEQYKNLKWIELITAGYDGIDLEYLKRRGILLTYAKDVFSIQIAEDVFSKILYFNRQLKNHMKNQEKHLWKFQKSDHELYGATIGIIGTGSIGQHIAERMKAFKTKVIGYKRHLTHVDFFDKIYTTSDGLYELLKESDYIIIAIPLTKDTKNLIDARALSVMKKDALIVNVARGEIIDQIALKKALMNNQIRGAALDVTSPEPLPKDDTLWDLDNCLITPHNASSSPKVNNRIAFEIIDTFKKYLEQIELDNKVV
ncbi:D-2-hydroxyacid dehydrogenase [Mariniplasma anaerobium]|uniref:Dihydrofolate reductase n=1 Tax=Mariniplasma anaerobium TaxID=2735436 RepID=A0A7U9XUV0_9MOLU|nr:D-2-hydroxyacid dehydrogenase [Mariniplasma anaerobium]BCR36307.1 dihydrofolate reductase [Mariniplasma anaerobium]